MALRTATIRPTTCEGAAQNLGCRIAYEYDDQLPINKVVYTPVACEQRCARHSAQDFPTLNALFVEARENEIRKNRLLSRLQQTQPGWFDSDTGELTEGSWWYDQGGNIHFACPNGTGTSAKASIQGWANGSLGNGRAVIE